MSNVTPALLLQYALKAYFKMELNTTAKKRAYKPSVSNTHLLFAALLPPEVMAFAAALLGESSGVADDVPSLYDAFVALRREVEARAEVREARALAHT